jgi:DNA-binding response OmpR family regulator
MNRIPQREDTMEQVLIVDDDMSLCELLKEYLTPEGFSLYFAHDVQSAVERACRENLDLLVLDVMLPGGSGFDVLRQIRQSKDTPVIMLTARGTDTDRILGLELGADDYLPKPFNPRELVARIRAVLRRSGAGMIVPSMERLAVGDLRIDTKARSVVCSGKEVELTSVEFSLLDILVRNAGRIVKRDTLAKEVLGRILNVNDRSIDVHISRIRKKLPDRPNGSDRIKSIRCSGYLYTSVD